MTRSGLLELNMFLGHPFSDLSSLEIALTAPGAEGDKEGDLEERIKYEGNRTLAQIGNPLHQLAVKRLVLAGVPRGAADDLLKRSFAELEKRAKSIGFYNDIKLNPRQKGIVHPNTLRLVFAAIVGAAYETHGRNESNITDVVNRLYFSKLPGLEGSQTISLPELDIHRADSWDEFINTCETGPSSPSDDLSKSKTSRKGKLPEGDTSILVMPEVSQLWESSSFELQPDNFMAPTNSWQLDELLESFGDMVGIGDHDTSPSLKLVSPDRVSTPRHSSETPYQPMIVYSGDAIAPETAIVAVIPPPELVPLNYHHPTRNLKSNHPDAVQFSSPSNASSTSTKRRSEGTEELPLHIGQEKKRCLNTRLSFSEFGFYTTASQDVRSSFQTLYFGIGSPEVIALLQELLKTRRERFVFPQSREKRALSPADRLRVIEYEDTKRAYSSFRKRCHIHQLFVDCKSKSLTTNDTFVITTPQTMIKERTSQIGNPRNLELSRISKSMFDLCFPGLLADDPTYKQKEKHTTRLRKLGQLLDLLVKEFGFGILGLIPLPSNEPTQVQALNITDEAIIRIPMDIFKQFLDYLKESLGNVLHDMSKALDGVVEAIFNEEVDHLDSFAIERCKTAQIVQYQRSSPELLQLISENINNEPG